MGILNFVSKSNRSEKKPFSSVVRRIEYPNIPGVNGFKFLNCFSFADCGVSAKLNHSNSCAKMGAKPILFASASLPFSSCLGQ